MCVYLYILLFINMITTYYIILYIICMHGDDYNLGFACDDVTCSKKLGFKRKLEGMKNKLTLTLQWSTGKVESNLRRDNRKTLYWRKYKSPVTRGIQQAQTQGTTLLAQVWMTPTQVEQSQYTYMCIYVFWSNFVLTRREKSDTVHSSASSHKPGAFSKSNEYTGAHQPWRNFTPLHS